MIVPTIPGTVVFAAMRNIAAHTKENIAIIVKVLRKKVLGTPLPYRPLYLTMA